MMLLTSGHSIQFLAALAALFLRLVAWLLSWHFIIWTQRVNYLIILLTIQKYFYKPIEDKRKYFLVAKV